MRKGWRLIYSLGRDEIELIAVVLGANTSAQRFETAAAMLDFGFANWTLIDASEGLEFPGVEVDLGKEETAVPQLSSSPMMLVEKERVNELITSLDLVESVKAPVARGQKLGELTVSDGESTLLKVDVVASSGIERLRWIDVFELCLKTMFLSANK